MQIYVNVVVSRLKQLKRSIIFQIDESKVDKIKTIDIKKSSSKAHVFIIDSRSFNQQKHDSVIV